MEPTRDTQVTLVDLLDRALDKGLMLNADLLIHVAGIPLLGVKLKACLAGMETMLKYGIWKDWDEAQRAVAVEEKRRKKEEPPLRQGEDVLLKVFASHWYDKGIWHIWRPGHLYVTDRRVFLFRKEPAEVLFQCSYEELKGLGIVRKNNIAGQETGYLYLLLSSGEVAQLHPPDAQAVKDVIEKRAETLGLVVEEIPSHCLLNDRAAKFLSPEEEIVRSGKMSCQMPERRPGGMIANVWKPGHLYLTTERLVWCYDLDGRVGLEVPVGEILAVEVKRKDLGGMLKSRLILDLTYRNEASDEVASFCEAAGELDEWKKAICQAIRGRHESAEDDVEECPGYKGTCAPAT